MKLLAAILLLLVATTCAEAQYGPYGPPPRPYYGPPPGYYGANPPRPPPVAMPCPNCGRTMIRRQVFRPGQGWVTIYVCPECN
jgi:hypothetical protein